MQTTSAAFTAQEKANPRQVAASALVSWKKQFLSTYKVFTIGVSTIGGSDAIAASTGVVSNWNKYFYFDESTYLQSLSYERGLKMPTGGLTMAMWEANFDNTSRRFTPRYMGGNSELFTAVNKVARPTIINAGFNYNGINQLIPQLVGINTDAPRIDQRTRTMQLTGNDFISFLQGRYLDNQIMFTSETTDQVMKTAFTTLGYSTAQYKLDTGINVIPFGLFDVGTRWSDLFDTLAEAENGHVYQDEFGVIRFENRQHWSASPYTAVQRVITTAMVINATSPNLDHLINVVEVNGKSWNKQPSKVLINYTLPTFLPGNAVTDVFFQFNNPVLQMTNPTIGGSDSYYLANLASDGSGADVTSSVSISNISQFAQAVKIRFQNNSSSGVYLTKTVISGREIVGTTGIYARLQDDSSVTAYQEHPFSLNNDYIQNQSWAASYAQMILNDFSEPENLQVVTVKAQPDIQLGDLVSWQGRYWRVFDIKTTLNAAAGFIQELTMLQRTITTYFRIGISTIGSSDKIAP